MDWQCAESSFDDNDFNNFKYEPGTFKIVMKVGFENDLERWDIESHEALSRWITENKPRYEGSVDGIIAIIFRRGENSPYSSPSYLPVTRSDFSKLIEIFKIHRTIVRTIRREITYFSSVACLGQDNNDIDSLAAYTARMSIDWPGDIAMSSTYLIQRRLSLSVFFGCNEIQAHNIEMRMENAGQSVNHPMLAPGILVELDRDRLAAKVDSVIDEYTLFMAKLDRGVLSPQTVVSLGKSYDKLSDLYNDSMLLVKGIGKIKHQISDMYGHTYEINKALRLARNQRKPRRRSSLDHKHSLRLGTCPISPHTGTQICQRLLEIEAEYDEKLDQCHMVPQGLTFATKMAADYANIRISIDSQMENSQMRSIAFVTMFYLPLTSVASIFSMGVFNWNATTGQSVLTFYFWVYLAIGGGLTVVTLGLWWFLTRTRQKEDDVESSVSPS
ncbi:hypothetical protein F5B19DRAFT_89000 [Rostrohypoxylon terebratum]|nr:hypothetical protein F5B19DRAFT_89000 [Rostrohypoxylon terebratum]